MSEKNTLIGGKRCSKCRIWKPYTEYHRAAQNKTDGYTSSCKECAKRLYVDPRAEIRRSRARNWNNAHKDRVRYHGRKNTSKRYGGDGAVFTDAEWLELKSRYNSRCLCCGKAEPNIVLVADHIVPAARGGGHTIDNIQPLCQMCNNQKKTKCIDYRDSPFITSRRPSEAEQLQMLFEERP